MSDIVQRIYNDSFCNTLIITFQAYYILIYKLIKHKKTIPENSLCRNAENTTKDK